MLAVIKVVSTSIVNVVATASLDQRIDFNILKKYKQISYRAEKYGGRVAYLKTKEMKGKVSIFLNGKMISVGTITEFQAIKELGLAMKFLVEKKLAKWVELQPIIQNVVFVADFQANLELENLSEDLKAIYEPEQFPGAILRLKEPFKTSILLFASGKAVITGLKSSEQIEPTIQLLKQLLELNQ